MRNVCPVSSEESFEGPMDIHATFLANYIITNFFNSSRCLLIFQETNASFSYSGNLPFLSIFPRDGWVRSTINYNRFGCQGVVINTLHPLTTLRTFEYNIKSKFDRLNERRYLLIPTVDSKENFKDLYKLPELRFLEGFIAIIPEKAKPNSKVEATENLIFNITTHKYVGLKGNNDQVLLDVWFSKNKSFLFGANLFPDKLTDQLGRVLKLSTFTYLPYTAIDPAKKEAGGTEIQMIKEYSKKHNTTLEYVVDEAGQWGKIHPNWTGIGVGGNLAMDKSDVGASAMFRWEDEYKYTDFAKSFVRTGVTTLLPAPRRAPGWLTPILSFTGLVWLAVVSSFLLSSAAFFAFGIRRRTKKPKTRKALEMEYYSALLTIFAMYLQQSIPTSKFFTRSSKVIMGTMCLYCLLLATSYSSGLASNLAVPRYEDAIDTTEEFANSKFFWAGTHAGAWVASIEEDNEPIYKTIVNKFIETNISEIKKLIHRRKSGIPIERLPSGHYAISKYMGQEEVEKLRPMSSDLYFEFTVVLARKSSILLPSLDKLILEVFESGLPLFWEAQASRKYLNMSIQMAIKHSVEVERQKNLIKLSVSHISGALAVWMIGLVVASLCFVYENYYFKYYRKKIYKFIE